MNVVSDSHPEADPSSLQAILNNLSGEIVRPLDLLQREIELLLTQPEGELTNSEREQAATMLTLCNEIDRLTRDSLESPDLSGS